KRRGNSNEAGIIDGREYKVGGNKLINSLNILNIILEDYGKEFTNQNEDDIFESFVAENYFKERDLALDEVKTGLIGGKHDWGIDGLYLYVNDVLINDI